LTFIKERTRFFEKKRGKKLLRLGGVGGATPPIVMPAKAGIHVFYA
jgi:hypothetical protein